MKAMKEKKGGGAPPVFLSTHPTDDQRIAAIRRLIPEAKRRARELRAAEARGGPVRSGASPAQPTRRTASTRNEPAGRADRVEAIRRETERLRRENRELRRKLEMR
jgi:predicted Zn-dependent protease